jgi:hypothetical protein
VVKPGVDLLALSTYVAGGGLAGVFACLDIFFPAHQGQFNGLAIALVAVAGVVRILANPTPTNTVQVFDRTTGSTVALKTVAAPSTTPAVAPTYAAPAQVTPAPAPESTLG